MVSDYTGDRRNIRSLGVIVDSGPYCSVTPYSGDKCKSPAEGKTFSSPEEKWLYFGYPYCYDEPVPVPAEEKAALTPAEEPSPET